MVPDIAAEGAFDHAVVSDPPFDAIIHSASPIAFVDSSDRVVPEVIGPALNGTTSLLKAAHAYAPSVKRIIYTSSFAAILHWQLGNRPGYTYSEKDWNPIELGDALKTPGKAYQTSKKLAEKAAWDFMAREQPSFDLVTMNPPMVYGPLRQVPDSLDGLNSSNRRVKDMMLGLWRDQIPESTSARMPPTPRYAVRLTRSLAAHVPAFCDVRDVAAAHLAALEKPAAGGHRFFLAASTYTNREIAAAVRKHLPKYAALLPTEETPGGGTPAEGLFRVDHSRAETVLGIKFRPLEDSIGDLGHSIEALVDAQLAKR